MAFANLAGKYTEENVNDVFADAILSRLQLPSGWDADPEQETDPLISRRDNFLEFATSMDPSYTTPRHIKAIAEQLEKIERGETTRLIITMPPQRGKSRTVSEMFPAWLLGRNPKRRIVLASYGADLANRNSRAARDLLTDDRWPWPNVQLDYQTRSVSHWQTRDGGYVHAVGVGGPLTGFSSDYLIIDDPFKDDKDSDSPSIRESRWIWFQQVALTRLSPGASVIVFQTRWHPDDMVGRILDSRGARRWTVINFPEIAEENDPLGRAVGDLLWPERFTKDTHPSIDNGEISTRGWDAMYQQRHVSEKGNLFKREWWKFYESAVLKSMGLVPYFTVVDSAFKTDLTNDYSVAATWGLLNDKAYLINIWRERVEFPELVSALRDIYAAYKAPILIEDKASGQSVLQVLARETTGMPRIPVIAVPVPRYSNKGSRANAVTRFVEAGMVFLPSDTASKEWVNVFIDEHATFRPSATNRSVYKDDQVDTTSMALSRLFQLRSRVEPIDIPERPEPVELTMGWERNEVKTPTNALRWVERHHQQRREQNEVLYEAAMKREADRTWQNALNEVELLNIMRRKVRIRESSA